MSRLGDYGGVSDHAMAGCASSSSPTSSPTGCHYATRGKAPLTRSAVLVSLSLCPHVQALQVAAARRAVTSLAAEDPDDLYFKDGEAASELLASLVRH